MKYVPGAQANNTKKELGQHWLRDEVVLQAIVDAADVSANDHILEIGPGLGTLTEALEKSGASIKALEFDKDLLQGLEKKFQNSKHVKIEYGDIRTFDFKTMPVQYKVVANIPYYLTSHLIRSISETTNPPSRAVLLIQKEVAERICAGPGDMGILSVTAQFYFDCQLDIEVPAALFTPPPKVNSQVIVLTRRETKLFNVDEKDFFHFMKAGFSEKRKTLRNALSGGLGIDKSSVELLLKHAGISQSARAQELSLDQWYDLYCVYVGT
jgi:16S rRNA (adenine1518-N6/adenine1519-N6)-dimethyltransferase